MGRPPKGDRAMTGTERRQQHTAKKLAAAAAAAVAALPLAQVKPDMSDAYLKFIHLRMDPARTAQYIYMRIGHDAAIALHRALGRVIEEAASNMEIDEGSSTHERRI